MRTISLFLIFGLLGLGIGGGVGYYRKFTLQHQNVTVDTLKPALEDQKKVQTLLREFHPKEAMEILVLHQGEFTEDSKAGKMWIALSIQASKELRDRENLEISITIFLKVSSTMRAPLFSLRNIILRLTIGVSFQV